MNGSNLKNVKLNKIWIRIQNGEKTHVKTTDCLSRWFFFRNQIRKDINTHTHTHTHTHTLGFKTAWHAEETGTAKRSLPRTPISQALRVFMDHSVDYEALLRCLNATQKLRKWLTSHVHHHLPTLEAHPEKMKCEEWRMSSSGKHRLECASASPKSHVSIHPWIAVRCPDCQRQAWVGIPDLHPPFTGWMTSGQCLNLCT